jgi:hypothetical protein
MFDMYMYKFLFGIDVFPVWHSYERSVVMMAVLTSYFVSAYSPVVKGLWCNVTSLTSSTKTGTSLT